MFFKSIILGIVFSIIPLGYHNSNADVIPQASIPIDVAMIYHKKINQEPDFSVIAKKSPFYQQAPDFAKDIILQQEIASLKKMYNDPNKMDNLIVFEDFSIAEVNQDQKTFRFENFDFNTHYTYDYNGKTYAVFIKNIDDYTNLPADGQAYPVVRNAKLYNSPVAAELTLRPVSADKKPFMLYDDKEANLILADLIDLKLILYDSGKVFYHEVASKWEAKSRLDAIIKDLDLKSDF